MKKWGWVITCIVVAGIMYTTFLFYKKPLNIRNEEAAIEISAKDLVKDFSSNESLATKKFADKVVVVTGSVSEIKTDAGVSISLSGDDPMSGVTCSFYADEIDHVMKIKVGDSIRIKGKCTGMLTDVILNNCSIVVQNK